MPSQKSATPTSKNLDGLDLNSAEGIIEFYKRELSCDYRGKLFSYIHLMPAERLKRRDSLRKIHLIVSNSLINSARLKEDIVPLLKEIQHRNPEDHETLHCIVKAYTVIKDCASGSAKSTAKWIMPGLLSFLEIEELEVRTAALDGIRDTIRDIPNTDIHKLYIDSVQLTLRVLAKSGVFHGRQSAAALIGIFFSYVNDQAKVELKDILVNLTYDESILVQLKAVKALKYVVENTSLSALKQSISVPDVAPPCQHNTFINVAVYLPFQNTVHPILKGEYIKVIQKTLNLMSRQSDVKEAVKLFDEALCDPNWSVRMALSRQIPQFLASFCRVDDSYAKSLIIPALLKLLIDPNYDIREQTLEIISNCLEPNEDQVELTYLLSDNYKKKLTQGDDKNRKLNGEELQILIESIVRSCTGGDPVTTSKLRLKVAEMMSRLVKALPTEYCESTLLPLQISFLTNIENTSEAVEAFLHCTSFYRKFNITTMQHELVEITFDLKQRGKVAIGSGSGTSLNIHNYWRIRCCLCQHLSVIAKLIVPKDPNALLLLLVPFMSDDVSSVREASYRTGAEFAEIFGDAFFFDKVLDHLVIAMRVHNPVKSTSLFSWRNICHLIEYAGPRLTTWNKILEKLLLKFISANVSAVRISALNAIISLLGNDLLRPYIEGSELLKQALTLSRAASDACGGVCKEKSEDVTRAADDLYSLIID